jgi:hypothetical protein
MCTFLLRAVSAEAKPLLHRWSRGSRLGRYGEPEGSF